MGDWIVGLQKAATAPRPGVSATVLDRLERELGRPLPEPLRSLYAQMDGGEFESDVLLYRASPPAKVDGLREHSRSPPSDLPTGQVWCFGERGSEEILFAAPRGPLSALAELPSWIDALPVDAWVYGIKNSDTGALKIYRSLEKLLWNLVPPVEVEESGENTFARALSAVGRALDVLEPSQAKGTAHKTKRLPAKKAKRPAAVTAKKPAKKKLRGQR